MFWNLYKVELLSPFFRMKAEHDRSKNKKDTYGGTFLLLRRNCLL